MDNTIKFDESELSPAICAESPIGIALIDTHNDSLNTLYSNKSFKQLLPEGLSTEIKRLLLDKEDISELKIEMKKEGLWVKLKIINLEKNKAIIWLNDISEIMAVTQEAEAMAEMKTNFLATMSHEIRSPMQSIYGFLELISDEDINEEVRGMVTTARKSASGLLEILDDILDLAKVEAGKIELDHFEIPLRTLAYGAVECMEVKLLGKPVELRTEIDQDIPFVLMGDPTRLRQILLNLISNAIKFTKKGSVTLRVTSKAKHLPQPTEGLALRFEITDTGIGMPNEVATKLFQPFTQADNSTTRKYGGTGLGLSISNKLVELMGGKIGVDSVEGQGSTFWFEIATEIATEQNAAEMPNLEGLVVLSVEDHPKGSKEIKSALSSMGATVESVSTYKGGLELVKQRPFDVVIADQGLPDGLGIDLLKEISKVRPFVGLILYSVRDDVGMQYTAKTIGAKFLPKPASRAGLGDAVKSAAKQISAHDFEGPRRLLIAEDTPAVRDVIKRQLDKLGIDADFAFNGLEALKILEKREHGILFTDLHMPEMDGYQLAAHIRGLEENGESFNSKRLPIIALTADVQLAQKRAYISYGFDECLLKPVSMGQLKQLLIRWGLLEKKSAAEEDNKTAQKSAAEAKKEAPAMATGELPPAIDKDAIIAQMGGFDESIIRMLHMFIDMTAPYMDKLEQAFNDYNANEIKEVAHSLKGSARSAGANRLGDLASQMQQDCEDDALISKEMIDAVKIEFARVAETIRNLKV